MTFGLLIRRSLRFHARAHLGVVLGATIGSAALVGALVVGDSVRESLRERALARLARATFALASPDRFFSRHLGEHSYSGTAGAGVHFSVISPAQAAGGLEPGSVGLLALPATASSRTAEARANQVQVYGVTKDFWTFAGAPALGELSQDAVVLNSALAAQLRVGKGDEVLLRVGKPRQLSTDAAIAQRNATSVGLRFTVAAVLTGDSGGDLNLRSAGPPPFNAFVNWEQLAARVEIPERQNLVLAGALAESNHNPPRVRSLVPTSQALAFLAEQVRSNLTLADLDVRLEYVAGGSGIELRSPRVFLDPPSEEASTRAGGTNRIAILTYLANLLRHETNSTPYSMVTAAGPPYTPAGMGDDEVLLSQWLADDLKLKPGDGLEMSYFLADSGARLAEGTNRFRVRGIVPFEGIYADRTLMPDFPGLEKAESTTDWEAGFPLVYKIRPQDEQYWRQRRGTPKAFITLAAGQKLWGNRFGSLTALRFPDPPGVTAAEHWGRFKDRFLAASDPESAGLRFQPVREEALRAASQSQDFGQLFLGFSFFLVVAALLLMALLFQFNLEQRVTEIGTLLALGFTPRQVRRLLLAEGACLALVGGTLGMVAGLGYARGLLWALTTIWRDAVGEFGLRFHATGASLVLGAFTSVVVAALTIWLTLRRQARRPARELLVGEVESRPFRAGRPSRAAWLAGLCGIGGLGLLGSALARGETANAEAFFGSGSLLLIAGLALAAVWFASLGRRTHAEGLTFVSLAVRGCARRRNRSLATVALLASGCFVIAAIGVFRLDAGAEGGRRNSGTGGFALVGAAALPVVQDLNSPAGREFYGLSPDDMAKVHVVPLRVRNGDEASCLNLVRAQKPRLVGVRPGLLEGRFTFAAAAKGRALKEGWELLRASGPGGTRQAGDDSVPAIGDANAIEWALGKKLGDTLDYTDAQGRSFKVRLVGAVANSILQGSLVIDEAAFVEKFPGESGYRMFLLDAPSNRVAQVSATLTRELQDTGLELTPTVQRLNAFNAVQNTYLGTFQVLGGIGLLLGSAGLGVIVLRNVLERRAELGLLVAVGFRRRQLQWLVLSEHAALLGLGLGLGVFAAAAAVLPSLVGPGTRLPYGSLTATLVAVLLNGIIWTWLATRRALRGNLLAALRNE